MIAHIVRHTPAGLSLLRLLALPWLAALAQRGQRRRWCTLLSVLMAVDLADGIVARRIGDPVALRRQRRIDGLADAALVVVAPLGALRLRPEVAREEAVPIGLLAGAQAASLVACFLRFGRLPRYRSAAYKWSAGGLGFALAGRIAGGPLAFAFRPAVALLTLAHLEALVITLLLDAYRQPITTVWLLLKGRYRADAHV